MGRRTTRTPKDVLRFRVELMDVEPAVWRAIEVPGDSSFWDLHVAIQDAMGWLDYHLHEFELRTGDGQEARRFGIPDPDGWDTVPIEPDWEHAVTECMARPGDEAMYTYDFGDDWIHMVRLEAIEPAADGVRYPRCVGGERACPPEDCGGASGYESLVNGDPDLLEWIGGAWDPARFDATAVRFSDPRKRLRRMFEG